MSYTLTTDELKIAECGTIDFSKFTDSTLGFINVDDCAKYVDDYLKDPFNNEGFTFIIQDALNAGFTKDEATTIINNLITKQVITLVYTVSEMQSLNTEDLNPYTKSQITFTENINGNWMYSLTDSFINYIANQN